MIRTRIVKRFTLPGTIDGHIPVGVTLKITGGDKPFRLTVITVNWGRGYKPGEFHDNVMRVLNKVKQEEYVVLLIQELDEEDAANEHAIFKKEMEKGTTLVQWATREPIAVSPGIRVWRKRKAMTMDQGTAIGAPKGTGPRRYFVSCLTRIHGVTIGFGNQHPHRNLSNPKVQDARHEGEAVTRVEVAGMFADGADLVIHGGDMNDTNYPKVYPREQNLNSRGLDTLRLIKARKHMRRG